VKADERRLLIPLLLLAVALTVATGAWGHLYNETDGQYGGAAKVMAQGGSWLVPENNQAPRLVKPPLLYWFMAGSMSVFGITEFAARLPGALSICAWVAATFLLGSRLANPWRGFLAGTILLTSLGTFTLGRIVMPEPTFCAFITTALLCLVLGRQNPTARRWWYLGFWLCASLASFTKGWHGLLYPLAIAAAVFLFRKPERADLKGLFSWSGILLFLAINLPWYVYIERTFPGYFHNLIFTEQIGHMTGSDAPATSYTDVPRWQFLTLHLAWFFPWSVVAFALLKRWSSTPPDSWTRTLLFAWAAIVLGSVLLTGQRQDYYAMAAWPVFALWLAGVLERGIPRPALIPVIVLLATGFAAALAIPLLTTAGTTGTVADRATAWTTVTNFDPSVWASLRWTALLTLGTALTAWLAGLWLTGKLRFIALATGAAALCVGALSGTAIVAPYFTSAGVADLLETETTDPTSVLAYDGGIDTGSSLLFYTDRPIFLLDQKPLFSQGSDLYRTTGWLTERWQDRRVVILTEESKLGYWRDLLGAPKLAPKGKTGTQIVLSNDR
jgi:4-amino-4-deoxy-L-arabinose transferase-like glycosyltransferase